MKYKNKRILITGGSSGIGKTAAIELAKDGAEIILQARSIEKLKIAAEEISSIGGKVHIYATDLTNASHVAKTADLIIKEVGLPHIIINSAGSGEWLSIEEASVLHYKTTMDSPYLATAYTCKVFYDKMRERGNGHFIIINSVACFFSFPFATGYTAARWAMLGLSRSLQADLYYTDFDVSMIALGKVDSPYFSNNPVSEERIPKIIKWMVPTLTLEASGKIIARVVQSKKNVVIKPFMMSLLVYLNRFFPGFFRWTARLTSYRPQY